MPDKNAYRVVTIGSDLYERMERLRERRRKALNHAELSWNNFLHEMWPLLEEAVKKIEEMKRS